MVGGVNSAIPIRALQVLYERSQSIQGRSIRRSPSLVTAHKARSQIFIFSAFASAVRAVHCSARAAISLLGKDGTGPLMILNQRMEEGQYAVCGEGYRCQKKVRPKKSCPRHAHFPACQNQAGNDRCSAPHWRSCSPGKGLISWMGIYLSPVLPGLPGAAPPGMRWGH